MNQNVAYMLNQMIQKRWLPRFLSLSIIEATMWSVELMHVSIILRTLL